MNVAFALMSASSAALAIAAASASCIHSNSNQHILHVSKRHGQP
jgi:hypothetical protein